ncbi:hypothetical protein [Paraburkholderia nemoris]|uniref:hypothetical protein n=1 Tax=Paraburkholderia nemoris TaxID=2793076 RepID=UPI001B8B887D|nr:hypothetical protein [Paraburkholderia nemoris]
MNVLPVRSLSLLNRNAAMRQRHLVFRALMQAWQKKGKRLNAGFPTLRRADHVRIAGEALNTARINALVADAPSEYRVEERGRRRKMGCLRPGW